MGSWVSTMAYHRARYAADSNPCKERLKETKVVVVACPIQRRGPGWRAGGAGMHFTVLKAICITVDSLFNVSLSVKVGVQAHTLVLS